MVRLNQLFEEKTSQILNVYTTAGYPNVVDTEEVVLRLAGAGVDIVALGMPSAERVNDHAITYDLLFEQTKTIREQSSIPIVLISYLKQVSQYGVEEFLKKVSESGMDGLVIPDLDMEIYKESYQALFKQYELGISFLISPETSNEKIRLADELTTGFLYVVSQSKHKRSNSDLSKSKTQFFDKLKEMNLKSPMLFGFGIHDSQTFKHACQYGQGAIIGSAFIRHISKNGVRSIGDFVEMVRGVSIT